MRPREIAIPLALAALALAAAGCAREYRPPRADQPHATMKVRRVYEASGGTGLREECTVNGNVALRDTSASELASTPHAGAFLVHPTPAIVRCGSAFFHFEIRMVTETYSVQVPYTASESYSCGSGTHYQTCTRSVTRYRSESRTRTVNRNVEVSDGACRSEIVVSPENGHVYLVDFTYRDRGVCSATCFEQVPGPTPELFENRPCPVPPPRDVAALSEQND